jgi:hypothetical protein
MQQNKYPRLQAALLCERVSTDQEGRHTIHNEFNQYTMGYSQPFTVLTIWRGISEAGGEFFHETCEIIAPDGRVVAAGESQPFTLRDATFRQVNTTLLEKVDFTHDGIYELSISLLTADQSAVSTNIYQLSVI